MRPKGNGLVELVDEKPGNDRELTADERKRLLKILFMQESLNDNQYHKLLDNN